MEILLLLVPVLLVLIVLVGCGLRIFDPMWTGKAGGTATGNHTTFTPASHLRSGLLADELHRGDDYLFSSTGSDFGEEIGIGGVGIDAPDYITDPQYYYMPQNIYYTDDLHTSGIDPCDPFDTGISTCDDDHWGSTFDDSWSSSSFDDSWSGGSSSDDW